VLGRVFVATWQRQQGFKGASPATIGRRTLSTGAQRPVYVAGQGMVPITRKKGATVRSPFHSLSAARMFALRRADQVFRH